MEVIRQDRREDRRYPIQLDLRYKLLTRSRTRLEGHGQTVNVSSGGLLFAGDQELPIGSLVELAINWPVLLQNKCPLTLQVVGRVIRSDESSIAIKTHRHEFLVRAFRSPSLPDNAGKAHFA